jgi:hypothetical protein
MTVEAAAFDANVLITLTCAHVRIYPLRDSLANRLNKSDCEEASDSRMSAVQKIWGATALDSIQMHWIDIKSIAMLPFRCVVQYHGPWSVTVVDSLRVFCVYRFVFRVCLTYIVNNYLRSRFFMIGCPCIIIYEDKGISVCTNAYAPCVMNEASSLQQYLIL